jgi:hypothetical protein
MTQHAAWQLLSREPPCARPRPRPAALPRQECGSRSGSYGIYCCHLYVPTIPSPHQHVTRPPRQALTVRLHWPLDTYTINAVGQDDFADVKVPDVPASKEGGNAQEQKK